MSSTPPISSVKSPIFLSYWDTTSSLTGISSAGAPGLFSNARLIPVIYEFLRAVRRVLEEFRLDLPLLIMRSDGHLMSSDYTALHPVETLLCGPAASTMGALSMTGEKRAVVVDMGGTTTDISIIRDGEPLRIEGGIQIAEWKTFVRGSM